MVVIRAGAGSLRPNEGVAEKRSVFPVVAGARRGQHGRTVALVTAGFALASQTNGVAVRGR